MAVTKVDPKKDDEVMTDFLETTTYDRVGDWEQHLTETEESEDEPEGEKE